MPDYTFAPAPVLIETTGEFAIGASGVLRPAGGGDAVQVWDLNGSPLPGVSVGPKGAHQAFKADIPHGLLDFGSVLLPASSLEQQEAGLTAADAATAAQAAAESVLGALATKLSRELTKRTFTGNYTLVVADAIDVVLHCTAGTAVTVTLPQDSTADIAQEVAIPWRQYGAGQVTFTAGTGATILSRGAVFKSAAQYAEGLVTKVAANTWLVSGDIVA